MEKIIINAVGVTFRMLLRYWAKDSKVLGLNIVDVEQFAQHRCCIRKLLWSFWQLRLFVEIVIGMF